MGCETMMEYSKMSMFYLSKAIFRLCSYPWFCFFLQIHLNQRVEQQLSFKFSGNFVFLIKNTLRKIFCFYFLRWLRPTASIVNTTDRFHFQMFHFVHESDHVFELLAPSIDKEHFLLLAFVQKNDSLIRKNKMCKRTIYAT